MDGSVDEKVLERIDLSKDMSWLPIKLYRCNTIENLVSYFVSKGKCAIIGNRAGHAALCAISKGQYAKNPKS